MSYLKNKPNSLEDMAKMMSIHVNQEDYKDKFKKELDKSGKAGIGSMTDKEKKDFFNKIDSMHKAKDEETKIDELTAGQKKLPPALQKAIKAKEKKEEVEVNEEDAYDGTPAEVKKMKEKEKADAEKAKSKKEEPMSPADIERLKKQGMKPKKEEVEITEVENKTYGWTLVSKAKDLAKKFADNMAKAVDEIEKLEKGLSKNPSVEQELRKYNEEVEITEGQFKEIDTRKGDLKLAKDKRDQLKNKYNAIMAGQASGDEGEVEDQIRKLSFSIKKQEDDLISLMKKVKENQKNEANDVEKKDDDKSKADVEKLNATITLLKQKLENEKHKAVKPSPNKETGEVPLSIGIAYKHLRDKMKTEATKHKKEDTLDAVQVPVNTFQKDKELKEPKGKTLTGEPKTSVEMNPKINHSF